MTWTTKTRTGSPCTTASRTACPPNGASHARCALPQAERPAASRFEAMLWKLELACANAQAQVCGPVNLPVAPPPRGLSNARLVAGACRYAGNSVGTVAAAAKLR